MTGNVFAEEPWCGYVPGTFPYADDVADLLADAGPGAAPVGRAPGRPV